ncbi:MAG: hypothetical protein A2Y77_03560 [Planctomycetes bacterium RBG_13_62_9]|nr:MAG: hypothetical protein A2Y77_03560 [Planctomycetes bacterium RBG_13_62_9]
MSILEKLFGSNDPKKKAERFYQKGLQLTRQQHYREAIPLLEEAVRLDGASAPIHNVLAFSYSQVAGEYEGDEQSMNSWMSKATDTFKKALSLHRQHGGLNQTQVTTATDLVAAVERITMDKSQSPPEETRRKVFKEFTTLKEAKSGWQDQAWAIIRGTGPEIAGDMNRVKAEAEEKAMDTVVNKYHITEWQVRGILQEGANKNW